MAELRTKPHCTEELPGALGGARGCWLIAILPEAARWEGLGEQCTKTIEVSAASGISNFPQAAR